MASLTRERLDTPVPPVVPPVVSSPGIGLGGLKPGVVLKVASLTEAMEEALGPEGARVVLYRL
ncbi:hypothetical protein GCM10007092_12150 [Thermus composti]|nr:hypothetical protein GCM10007092_12150 [Thermus composti]